MNESLLKKLDIVLLIFFPVLAVVLSLAIRANFLISTLLFLGLPSLWLSIRTPSTILKTLIFSLIFSIPVGIILDYIGTLSGSWLVPVTVLPFRFFDIVPIEDLVWFFFLIYNIIIFYEHFLDKGREQLVDRRMKYLIWPLIVIFITFLIIWLINPGLLMMRYAYLWILIIVSILPSITFLSFFPRLLSKYVKTAAYFFLIALLFELTGLELGQWAFPGDNFVGWVELFGYRFPFEEFFAWFIMAAICVLSYYEFFDDDHR
ncbi:MAG: hypothetical protein Q8Q37_02955 [bacterium]|nr:hypothetical protein [bacterium]